MLISNINGSVIWDLYTSTDSTQMERVQRQFLSFASYIYCTFNVHPIIFLSCLVALIFLHLLIEEFIEFNYCPIYTETYSSQH